MAILEDIPTERFKAIVDTLRKQGWEKIYEYDGFDAWIDYGKIILKKGMTKLTFEWDNWTEGSIEGPDEVIAKLAR